MTSRHVAVLAFPFGSHADPLLSLVRKLAKAGPDVKFSFLSSARSNGIIFSEADDGDGSFRNIKPYNVNDGLPEGYVPSRNPVEPVELFLKETPENFTRALEAVEAETGLKVGCLVSDAFFWFAGDMADKMNVPWIPLWTAAPRSLLLHVETDAIRQALTTNGSGDQTLDFLPGFSVIRKVDLPEGVMISENSESPFQKLLHKMGHKLPQATAVAINSFQQLDPDTLHLLNARFKKFLNVGPFALTCPSPSRPDDHGCLEWLDKHQPSSVVYISFGTVITPPPHEIAAFAEALEASGFPFLWSFKGSVDNLFSKGFLERTSGSIGKLVPWAPQVQVLHHSSVGAFVTHCGWNSISDSIGGGVPMICRPFFGDQKLNLRMVEAVWKIGVEVEGGVFTKSGTTNTLQRILLACEGKEMRERIGVLKKLAHEAVKSNGSSTNDFNTLVGIVNQM